MGEAVSYTEKDLFDLAEQVLLCRRDIESLEVLGEDDLARIQAAVRVGPALWADEGRHAWEEAYAVRPLQVKSNDGAYVYVADRTRRDLLSVSRQLSFQPLSFSFLFELDQVVLCRLCEVWSRGLTPPEQGIFLRSLSPAEVDKILDSISDRQSQDWEHLFRKRWEVSQPGFEEIEIQKKASLLSAEFLVGEEELPQAEVNAYLTQLKEELTESIKSLPEKMGVVGDLDVFSDRDWTLLAGFTPREDMVHLAFVLDKDLHEKLIQPLPERQKPDIKHSIALAQQAPTTMQIFHDRLQAYKRWISQIVKVQSRSLDSE